jgi:hypothetical protein
MLDEKPFIFLRKLIWQKKIGKCSRVVHKYFADGIIYTIIQKENE